MVLNGVRFGGIIGAGLREPDAGARFGVLLWALMRWLLAVALIVLPATLLHAALPAPAEVPDREVWLTGQLLIASPDLRQPPFDHAVILMAQHSKDGALGVIINRPLDERPIAGLLEALGADASGVSDSVRVFVGGPVSPDAGLVLHSAEYRRPRTLYIDGRVALSGAAEVLRDIGLGKGPSKSLLAFGYAGWAPAQLENELAQGVWMTAPEDPALVFDDDRAQVWAEAVARHKAPQGMKP